MSDFLLELSKNPNARKLIQTLGLPIPLPQALDAGRQKLSKIASQLRMRRAQLSRLFVRQRARSCDR